MDEKILAVEKLKKEYADAKDKFGRYEKVLAEPVLDALESFIGQSDLREEGVKGVLDVMKEKISH